MKKFLMVGDTHGNGSWMRKQMTLARELECDAVIQLGDFGLWPGGESYLNVIKKEYWRHQKNAVPVYWIDGNHDWHDRIDGMIEEDDPATEEGFYKVEAGCYYIPRGNVWEWEGVRFGALGGAYSIDRKHRQLGLSWWKQEIPSDQNVDTLIDNASKVGGIDVLLTHEAPALPPTMSHIKDMPLSDLSRDRVRRAMVGSGAKMNFHGHYHWFHDTQTDVGRVVGLNCDPYCRRQGGPSQGVLVVEDGKIEFGTIGNDRTRI